MKIAAIVVTYNRKKLLELCLTALENQTIQPLSIIIIDNASTDGTEEWFQNSALRNNLKFIYLRLENNSGGAGGFSAGINYAVENKYDWSWIMDDDASPEKNALEELIKIATSPNNIYGSIAVQGEQTSWITTLLQNNHKYSTTVLAEIPDRAIVGFLPFLGLLISKEIVQKIGLPDPSFFIAADDVEYCLRAQAQGAQIIVAGKSRINHPKSTHYTFNLPFKKIGCLELSPWKRYYDVRNRILIARKYYGIKTITHTIPGSLIRFLGTLINEPQRLFQTLAFCAGMIDGLLGIKGKRHTWWRIKQ